MTTTTKFLLLCIITIGFVLRSFNLMWDMGYNLHPDERAIIMTVLDLSLPTSPSEFFSPNSPLNPHFFAYGNMPFYLLKISAYLYSFIDASVLTYNGIAPLARSITIVVELMTMITIFILSRKLFSNTIALIATALYAVAVFPIQLSHFFTSDPFMSLFILLTLLMLMNLVTRLGYKNSMLTGLFFGLALASKISALPLLFPIAVTFIFLLANNHKISINKKLFKRLLTISPYGITIALSTCVVFFVTQPYVLIDFSSFIEQSKTQSEMTKSAFTFPYTLQYVGKIPYWYELKNIFLWGFGPATTVLSAIGLYRYCAQLRKSPHIKERIILLSFVGVYFLIIGSFAVGWMRYSFPLYPFLSLFAAIGITFLFSHLKKSSFLSTSFLVVVIVLCAVWPVSFMNVYSQPHTRVAATDWIIATIPPGSIIAVEHWDDRIPLYGGERYTFVELPLYEPDTETKWSNIQDTLHTTDYIVIASNRLYTPLQKLTNCNTLPQNFCYPLTAQYYQDLFQGDGGFTKVKEFSVYPKIPFINLSLSDLSADESFSVYDHPKVIIFKKNP